ncbi:EAL domain-containing protein [Halomonas urumqiensis]|uniref:GGDEF domain-containing protein n=1 Tax=Halomonas urumqiensis TaxID=1684789 RepID=A0A2N7UNT1_9GAMM|nr:EAL domain-containing protein [Halomonas urumqiensis]PMR82062.1 hypothetical protein C1H70_02345 [Halomonas urumqiensis]PTB02606.1 PAS domain S-box protein [Halomonas urumqiensis]GHE21088.1 hypothetical protein GCM10017767_16090 [Halomonas urumqiensis]
MAVDASGPPKGTASSGSASAPATHPSVWAAMAFEFAPVGLAVVDENGCFEVANRRFCQLSGLVAESLRGSKVCDHLPVRELIDEEVDDIPPVEWQELEIADGACSLLMTVSSLRQPEARLLTLLARDEEHALMAGQDALTGLANAWLFHDRLYHAAERADRLGQQLALLLIELDDIEALRKRLGPAAIWSLLHQVSRRIDHTFRGEDSLARLDQARWGVLIEHPVTAESLQSAALRFQEAMDAPFDAGSRPQLLTTSIGIARYPVDSDQHDALLGLAEAALANARKAGPANHAFHDTRLRRQIEEQASFRLQLHEALMAPSQHFRVVYQPQLDPATLRCMGFEALVRWQHPRRGLLHPRDFLPVAAEMGQLIRLDRWVLEQVIKLHQHWRATGDRLALLGVSVNLAAPTLEQDVFDGRPLDHFLRQQGVELGWLALEIEVQSLLRVGESQGHLLKRLVQLDVSLVVDELGVTPLDLYQLATLPVTRAKISRELVSRLGRKRPADLTLEALARSFEIIGLAATVVGVETESQLKAVRKQGFDRFQGNLVSPPMDGDVVSAWCAARSEDN